MSRTTAWFVHLSAFAAGATGLVYAWMRFLLEPEDEFAITHHPQELLVKTLHIVLVPLLVFGCGLIWRDHVWPRIARRARARRATGLLLAATLLPMTVTGYLLQVAEDETWRQVWSWSHTATGVAFALGYLVHQLRPRRTRAARVVREASAALEAPAES